MGIRYIEKIIETLSELSLLDEIYLEGGYVLSKIYKIDRIFSGDLDVTIPNKNVEKLLLQNLDKITDSLSQKLSQRIISIVSKNRVTFKTPISGSYNLDYYIVSKDLIDWMFKNIELNKNKFQLKIHSLQDIFIEKICCILDKDRNEFKDLWDICKIKRQDSFKKSRSRLIELFKIKTRAKKLESVYRKDLVSYIRGLEDTYHESYKTSKYLEISNVSDFKLIYKEVTDIIIAIKNETT